jgi:hypothetical protein
MSIEPIFGIDTIKGIGARSSIWQILEAFVTQTEGLASRVSFGPTGAIILTTIPGDPNSGAFYLYDGNTSTFFSLTFDNQESFNASWFDLVVCAYDLHMFVDIPVAVDEKPLLPHNRRRHHRGQHANNRPNEIHVQRTLAA